MVGPGGALYSSCRQGSSTYLSSAYSSTPGELVQRRGRRAHQPVLRLRATTPPSSYSTPVLPPMGARGVRARFVVANQPGGPSPWWLVGTPAAPALILLLLAHPSSSARPSLLARPAVVRTPTYHYHSLAVAGWCCGAPPPRVDDDRGGGGGVLAVSPWLLICLPCRGRATTVADAARARAALLLAAAGWPGGLYYSYYCSR